MENQEFNPPPIQNAPMPKLVYVLIVILILGLGGIGGYLLGTKKTSAPAPTTAPKIATKYPVATTSDETAGLKIYKDAALGFEFKYPSSLGLEFEKPNDDGWIFNRVLKLTNQEGEQRQAVGVLVYYDNPNDLSLKDFENKLSAEDRSGQHVRVYMPTDDKIAIAGNETGFLNKNGVYEPFPVDLYIFPKNKKIYIWVRYQNISGEYKREAFFDQIISTFKFLPQISPAVTDETANWKLYINNKYGFQLKYPSRWYSCNLNKEDNLFLLDQQNKICDENGVMPPGDRSYPIHIYVETGIKNKAEFISSWQKNNFKATPQSNLNLPLNSTNYSLEKIQAAPGPDGMVMILTPLKGNTIIIQVNDLSLTNDAYQILSTFRLF